MFNKPQRRLAKKALLFLAAWLASISLALAAFGLVRPTLAQTVAPRDLLADFIMADGVTVGSETREGYQHVYYEYAGDKTFITEGPNNNTHPDISGEFIVWERTFQGAGQIMLHNLRTGNTTQLTNTSTNLAPKVAGGRVVWEGWAGDTWQVFLFDGLKILPLTEGDLAVTPAIEGDIVRYARRDAAGEWRSEKYFISSGESFVTFRGLVAKQLLDAPSQVAVSEPVAASDAETEITPSPSATPGSPTPEPSPSPVIPAVVTKADILKELAGPADADSGQTDTPVPKFDSSTWTIRLINASGDPDAGDEAKAVLTERGYPVIAVEQASSETYPASRLLVADERRDEAFLLLADLSGAFPVTEVEASKDELGAFAVLILGP